MRHVVIAALLFGASTTHVLAQPDAATMERLKRDALDSQLGTLSVVAQPNFADGRLSGCTVEYNVLAKDWAYKKGDYIKVSGAFGLMEAGSGTIGVVLKVILHDVDPRGMQLTPSPPARANFVTSRFSTTQSAAVASYQSDTPGAIFVVFQEVIMDGLTKGKVTIAFSRLRGGTDLQIAIDTFVEDTSPDGQRKRSPNAVLEFSNCVEQLVKNSQQRLEARP